MDSLAVGQKFGDGNDERVILFVKLPTGEKLSKDLEQRIKTEIRSRRSPRHVPAQVRFLLYETQKWLVKDGCADNSSRRCTVHAEWQAGRSAC